MSETHEDPAASGETAPASEAAPAASSAPALRTLVTGGSGFLGHAVVPRLIAQGDEVVGLCRSEAAAEQLRSLGADVVMGDLDDASATTEAFSTASADRLLNLASLGFGHAGTIVDATVRAGITRAVFVSTTGIYTHLPAASKSVRLAAEERIRTTENLAWTIVRPTMIYGGPGDRNMARLLATLLRSPVVPLPGKGGHLQQPILVDDLAEVLLAALNTEKAALGEYNVAGPEPLTFREVISCAARVVGRTPRFVPVPLGVARRMVGLYETRSTNPRLKVEQIDRLEEDKAFDISAAQADLGFSPQSFELGIATTARRCGIM